MEHVFAYGSLVSGTGPDAGAAALPCRLGGHRRFWGVAMDNSVDLPAYKHYLDRAGGRPRVLVAFLDLERCPGRSVIGVAVPVEPRRLAELDRRERNYRRVEVTGLLDPAPPGRAWTFVGSPEGRARLARGVREARAVVCADYLRVVEDGFRALGARFLDDYRRSTRPPPCPVADLRCVRGGA